MANNKIQQLKEELERGHGSIPDQAFRSAEQHARVSIQFAAAVLEYIDEHPHLDDAFYKTKGDLSRHNTSL